MQRVKVEEAKQIPTYFFGVPARKLSRFPWLAGLASFLVLLGIWGYMLGIWLDHTGANFVPDTDEVCVRQIDYYDNKTGIDPPPTPSLDGCVHLD